MDNMFLSKLADSSALSLSNAMRAQESLDSYTVFPLPNGNANEYAITAAADCRFNVAVAVKETAHHLYLNTYDLMEDEFSNTISLADIIAGDGDELKKGDSVFGQTYKYILSDDDKELINSIVESSSYSLEEVFSFIVAFLEDLPYIPNPKKGMREIKAEDLTRVLRTLMHVKRYSTNRIIDTLSNASTDEKFEILSTKSKDEILKVFKAITID